MRGRRSEQEASSSGADPEEERNSGVSNWKAFRKFSTWQVSEPAQPQTGQTSQAVQHGTMLAAGT